MAKHLRDVLREAWEAAGKAHHRRHVPKHFTAAGAREYGYQPRQGERGSSSRKSFRRSYTGQKLRKWGHTLPLVWSGDSLRRSKIEDVRATSKGVRVVLHTPRFNLRPPGRKENMSAEVQRVSLREHRFLTDLVGKRIEREMNLIRQVSVHGVGRQSLAGAVA